MDEFYCFKTAAALLIRLKRFRNWYRFLPYMGSCLVTLDHFLCHSLSCTSNESHWSYFHFPFWL